jgi:hypothetical protein
MKLLLGLSFLMLFLTSAGQSADYISVKNKKGRTIRNYFKGTDILLQTKQGDYLQGPIKSIRNDSVTVTVYDIRVYPTIWGTRIKDTVAVYNISNHYQQIRRIFLSPHQSFFRRNTGSLLMIGGAGYLALNVFNGSIFSLPVTDEKNTRKIGISAGDFAMGFLFNKLFRWDGFTTKKHRIVYVDLSKKKL